MAGVLFLAGAMMGLLMFTSMTRSALELTQHLIQWVAGVKWPGRGADNSPASSTKVMNVWSYTSTPTIRFHDTTCVTDMVLS
jgi:hypothetical protein